MSTTQSILQLPFVDLAAQYRSIESEVQSAIAQVLRAGDFVLGQEVTLFEEEFAAFCGARYGIGVDSGLSALELILRAYGIGPNDEVITTANTFIASALAISAVGAKPVFVDIDPLTYNMDPAAFEAAITPRTAAVMPVHLYGRPAEMEAITAIASRHGLIVVEDACQAHGATYHGRPVGSLGHAAAFSFYPAKNLGAYGDGGIVVTSDSKVMQYVRLARNYGQSVKYHHDIRGFNRRLDTVQAAVLRIKLKRLPAWNRMRADHAALYCQYLAGSGVVTPGAMPNAESVWHLFVVRAQNRDGLRQYLDRSGISTGIHYPVPIHLQDAYQDCGCARGSLPVTEQYAGEIVSLPMFPELTVGSIQEVSRRVAEFVQASRA